MSRRSPPVELDRLAALATEIRRRLGPVTEPADLPLVSIVVLNRDGVGHLRRLLAGLIERTDYPRMELILVDNGSTDDSLEFIRGVEAPFPISIVANPRNESFSDGCNQGAERASGELLLFLNNDTEPFEPGWLRELVACERQADAAAVAATLICRDEEHGASFEHGYGVQHRGLVLREEGGMIHPVLHGWEADPLDELLGVDVESPAVAAACLLVRRDAFEEVGGFTRGYVYGAEDVDLCLKLRARGWGVLCSGRSIAVHHPVSTRRLAPFEEERARKLANRRLLWERWGPRLRREYERGRNPATGEEALGFCFHESVPGSVRDLESVAAALRRDGRRTALLQAEAVEDEVGLNYDVAVYVGTGNRYKPKPGQLNVLWAAAAGLDLSAGECSGYDLVVSRSAEVLTRLGEEGLPETARALLAGSEPALLAASLVAAIERRAREIELHAGWDGGRRDAARTRGPAILGSPDVQVDLTTDSPILAVAFGGLLGRLGGVDAFEFMGTLSKLGTKCAFVRDANLLWYQGGVEGVGSSIDSVAEGLEELVRVAEVERVVFIGASSGGYAALLFGGLVGAQEVLAFAPQTFLDPERRSAAGDLRWPEESRRMAARLEPRYSDLLPLLEARSDSGELGSIQLHYAVEERVDVIHAEHLADVREVRLIPHTLGVDGARAHVLPAVLRRQGRLETIVSECVYGPA